MVNGDINASLVTFNLCIYSMLEVFVWLRSRMLYVVTSVVSSIIVRISHIVCLLIGGNRYVFAKCCSVGRSVIPSFRLLFGCPKPLLTKHNTALMGVGKMRNCGMQNAESKMRNGPCGKLPRNGV